MTTTNVTAAGPRRSPMDRDVAMRLAADEYTRFLAQLRRLSPTDWQQPTDCSAWDVKALVGHVVGMTEMSASIPEQLRQMRAAGKSDGIFIDALTALQVDKHRQDTPDQLLARHAVVGPKAAKGRRRTPSFIRSRTMPVPQPVGGVDEQWTLGFLVDIILTRDTWMHRMDVARAAGQEPELTAAHDGVLVADVVSEWATRHGQSCSLRLSGPAGGAWTFGSGGPAMTYDAVDFCRGLSGRGEPALGTELPF